MNPVVWIEEHISSYQGDATKIIVTGDSAGGNLADGFQNTGSHSIRSDASALAREIYLCRLNAGSGRIQIQTKRMLLLK